jgi:acetyl-CoA synthetase
MDRFNIGYETSNRWCEIGMGDKICLSLVDSSLSVTHYTYRKLSADSDRFAAILSALDLTKGDRVAVLLPKSYEQYFIFLGIFKNNCVAVPLFYNIGEDALIERGTDSEIKVLVTTSSYAKKLNNIKKIPSLKFCIVVDSDADTGDFLSLYKLLGETDGGFNYESFDSGLPAIIHYTSGSTGRPKGVVHSHSNLPFQLQTFKEVFQPTEGDNYWCTAEPAWITGSVYGIIAPLAYGVNLFQYTGNYSFDVWLNVIKKFQINILYTAPTALRMLKKDAETDGAEPVKTDLKRVYTVGEPLNPQIIKWVKDFFSVETYDTWFQTETGAIMISNRPGIRIKYGSMGIPVSGVEPAIIANGKKVIGEKGELTIKSNWPSMFKAYYNAKDIYEKKFDKGYYFTGDMAYIDEDGYFWFIGRNDDVINVAGHLVSPFEIESALLEMEEVSDVAVVGLPDDMHYEKVAAFVTFKDTKLLNIDSFLLKSRIHVSRKVSPFASPALIVPVGQIPKNKSGKIMRRLLKAQYLGKDPGDTSTLD